MPILAIVLVGLHAIFLGCVEFLGARMEQFAGYASPTVVRMLQILHLLRRRRLMKHLLRTCDTLR